jgi:CHAT domain-containing protein
MGNVVLRPCDSARTCITEAELAEQVAELVAELQAVKPMTPDSQALALSYALYEALIAPIEDLLTTETLRIEPSGVIELVPFAALARPDANGNPIYLLADHRIEIASIPARRATPIERSAAPQQSIGWIVAPRTYNPELEREPEGDRALRSALALAESVSPRFPGSAVYTGTDASKDALKSALGRFDVVHVGAHAELAASTPYIQLAPQGPLGQLTPCEIMSHGDVVRSRLVVLAACNSVVAAAQEEFAGASRLASLGMAFSALGVSNVVGTLWEVSADVTSQQLMARFYDGLDERLDVTHALTDAQRELMASGPYAHPYYWAGFVTLVSDTR